MTCIPRLNSEWSRPMQYRALGRTGLQVSVMGFGTWGIGGSMWIGARDEDSLAALRRAVDLEWTFFDTAHVYGMGHSEQLIGQVFRECKGKTPSGRPLTVASKVPPKNNEWPARRGVPARDAFPADHIIRFTENSLKDLGLETLDLQQLHVWQDEWLAAQDEWFPAIEKLKSQGKIRAFGLSINSGDPNSALQAVASGLVDSVQVIYNVFEQSPEDALFPLCQKHNVGVIARVPLDEGGLTGTITMETTFPPGDFRERYFAGDRRREVIERVERLRPLVREAGCRDVAELALRFCISHPAVSTVIPGMRTTANVERNARAADAGPLPDAIRTALRAHRWDRTNWGG